MRELKASIVIPTYNAEKTISQTIKACLKQDYPYDYEIIVVDDGSIDSTAEIVKGYRVRYIHQGNAGPARARNTGWKAGTGEIICFTDSDCIPRSDWLLRLLEGFDSDKVGAVAGSYNIANEKSLLSKCIHEEIKLRHSRFGKYIRAFGSYNVAIRRSVLKQVDGFDESYRTSSGEDNDLSYKILKAHYKIVFKWNALVTHYHTEKLWKYLKEQYRHGYWRMKLYKNFPDMRKGDDYTSFKDIIEPPLSILVLGLVPFIWHKYGLFSFLSILTSILILQIPTPLKIIIRKRNLKFIYLLWTTFLRSFARGLGMLQGFWVFNIIKR